LETWLSISSCERGDGEGVGEGVRVEAAERFGAGTERGLPATRGGRGLRVTTDWGRPLAAFDAGLRESVLLGGRGGVLDLRCGFGATAGGGWRHTGRTAS